MENDLRLKQLMNTYTEKSGVTHVCSGQLLREALLRGLHRSTIFSGIDKCNYPAFSALYLKRI